MRRQTPPLRLLSRMQLSGLVVVALLERIFTAALEMRDDPELKV